MSFRRIAILRKNIFIWKVVVCSINYISKILSFFQEFDEVENNYWFDFKQKKFLHNIDTFYYSVKFKQDFTAGSKDLKVKHFRKRFELLGMEWERLNDYSSGVSFYFDGLPGTLNYKPFRYAGFYNVMLECPELFDIFLAPKFRGHRITVSP